MAISACEIRLFRYRSALSHLATAEALAAQADDQTTRGAIAGNTAVVYSQLGDYPAAEAALRKAALYLKNSPRRDYYVRALINLGDTEFGLGRIADGHKTFHEALATAKKNGLKKEEATASDSYGIWLVLTGDLVEAEKLLRTALRIDEELKSEVDISATHEHLAELGAKKGGLALSAALQDINQALATRGNHPETPYYYPLHTRGRINLELGKRQAALADFQHAVSEADLWRQSALPGDTTRTRTVAQLTEVYRDFAQLAATLSLQTGNRALASEAFEVLARNRAASLREQLNLAYRSKLLDSPEYSSLLARLQTAQANVTLNKNKEKSDEARDSLAQIRFQLNDLENRLGLDKENVIAPRENNRNRNLLRDIQSRLGGSAALLSISLGDPSSFLWTVTSTELKLYPLPARKTIEEQANRFRNMVHQSSQKQTPRTAGRALSQSLFSHIPASVAAKPEWLIAADGELLDSMPFAALPGFDGGDEKNLIGGHSLRILPGAMLAASALKGSRSGDFTGVGDPIYNRADSRWDRKANPPPTRGKTSLNTLARLVGSEKELRASASACSLPHSQILIGREASSAFIRKDVAAEPPQILHFAVHVISPEGRPGEAALALSLTKDGIPELLTAEAVSTFRVPGALVVLSGCSSQQGEVLPGSGIVGLSRSWLLAGADAVVVSAWPTPDDSGQFFSTFYKSYRQTQGAVSRRAALALRQTQLDMIKAGDYHSDVSFWAAYSIVSKE